MSDYYFLIYQKLFVIIFAAGWQSGSIELEIRRNTI